MMDEKLLKRLKMAATSVKKARPQNVIMEAVLISIQNYEGNIEIENLEITKKELREITKKGCKVRAKQVLAKLKTGSFPGDIFEILKNHFYLLLVIGDISLTDIGCDTNTMVEIENKYKKKK